MQSLTPRVVEQALHRLTRSAVDYGTLDLRYEQDLLFLYHELHKQVVKPEEAEDPVREVGASSLRAHAQASELTNYLLASPDLGRTFDLALLGSGASVAYYITAHKGSIDPMSTIVIGKEQPWARERGPGVVNHPLHMIDALRREVGLSDESLAGRTAFSDIVARVIDDHVVRRIDAEVHTVTRILSNKRWFYEIEVQYAGDVLKYYARRVVAGLGIGGHVVPAARRGEDGKQDDLGGRAMNMDEFQHRAKHLQDGSGRPRTSPS